MPYNHQLSKLLSTIGLMQGSIIISEDWTSYESIPPSISMFFFSKQDTTCKGQAKAAPVLNLDEITNPGFGKCTLQWAQFSLTAVV